MRISLLFTGWLALLLVIAMTACGTQNVGTLGLVDGRQVAGVQLGGYEVIRYNAVGVADPSLNGTLDLRLDGDALVVSVNDGSYTSEVLLDVKYDAGREHPVKAEFHGLLGTSENVLSAAFIDQSPGLASVGEVAIGDYKPAPLHGDAATITFAPGALHATTAAGQCYAQTPAGVGYIIEPTAYAPGLLNLNPNSTTPGEIHVALYSLWARADANGDHIVNIADMAQLGIHFGKTIDVANFNAVGADMNNDGVVNIQDLSHIGIHWMEVYDQFEVEASDDAAAAARTAVDTLLLTDGAFGTGPAAHPDLKTLNLVRNWAIDFTAATPFTYLQLAALDTDDNGFARIWVTPQETSVAPGSDGQEAFVDVPVVSGNEVEITGYDIQAVGATGGTGTPPDIFIDGAVGARVANQSLDFKLNSVSGTWNGEVFSEGALAGGMTAADYTAIETAVAGELNWTFANEGDSLARFVSPWFVPNDPLYAGVGDPGPGAVCPDDDPQSPAATPEGGLDLSLAAAPIASGDPQINITVPAALNYSIGFDLEVDDTADIIEGYYTGPDFLEKFDKLYAGPGIPSTVFLQVTTFNNDGSDLPNGPDCSVELKGVVGKDGNTETITLDWDDDTPADFNPEPGEFMFWYQDTLNKVFFVCTVPSIQVQSGSSYALRFFNGTSWSSINKPDDLLLTEPPPPPEDLLTLPKLLDRETVPAFIQIFMNEPNVRRDGRIVIDMFAETADPKDDVGFADQLKTGGTEFPISLTEEIVGGNPVLIAYPKIVVKDSDDGAITGPSDPGAVPDITIPLQDGREKGRIVAEVTMLMLNLPPGIPGDPNDKWNYKLFSDATGTAVGTGSFEVPQEPHPLQTPTGVEWGINVGARGDWNKIDFNSLCTTKSLNASSMITPTPDVFWVRFNGDSRVLDWDEYWNPGGDVQQDNIQVIFEDEEAASMKVSLYMEIIGVTANGDYIAIRHFNLNDGAGYYYDWVAAFPGNGILNPNHSYFVKLDDASTGGTDFTFPDLMNVVGLNPNFP